jgi:branched-chain amino acid transport system permease protein
MPTLTERYSYLYAPFIKDSYKSDEAIFRTRYTNSWFLLFVVAVFAAPLFLNNFQIYFLSQLGVAVLGAMGLNILIGYTGLISLGHSAFIGVGAYTYALLIGRLHWPFYLGILGSGVVAAFMGMFIGIPALRIKGIYLAIATLAFSVIASYTFIQWESLTGGVNGIAITAPRLGNWVLSSNIFFYYLIIIVLFLGLWMAKNLFRSKYGRAMVAIRDNDISSEVIGIPVFRYKILSFVISSFYAGVTGALFAILMRNVNPYYFGLSHSIEYLAMVIVGGMGTVVGSILGASIMVFLPELLNSLVDILSKFAGSPAEIVILLSPAKLMVLGFIIIFFIHVEPTGLAGIWRRIRDYFRIWPLPYI